MTQRTEAVTAIRQEIMEVTVLLLDAHEERETAYQEMLAASREADQANAVVAGLKARMRELESRLEQALRGETPEIILLSGPKEEEPPAEEPPAQEESPPTEPPPPGPWGMGMPPGVTP